MNHPVIVLGEAKRRILHNLTTAGFGEQVLVDDVIEILDDMEKENI